MYSAKTLLVSVFFDSLVSELAWYEAMCSRAVFGSKTLMQCFAMLIRPS